MKLIKYIVMAGLLITTAACKKDGFLPLTDNRAAVEVNVSNATDYRPGATVTASRATNTFNIVLEIPASSGRTIKEITKVVSTVGSSSALFGTTGLYNAAPIAGSGTKATFSTSLTELVSKTAASAVPANNPPVNAIESPRQFYFLVTLDNNETVISQQVRVLIVP